MNSTPPRLPWWSVALAALTVSILLVGALLGFGQLLQPVVDVQMHNTYFVFPPYGLVLAVFVPLALLAGLVVRLSRHSLAGLILMLALHVAGISLCSWLLLRIAQFNAVTVSWPAPQAAATWMQTEIILVHGLQMLLVASALVLVYRRGRRAGHPPR
ncbi:hypothetical protein LRS06_11770 [Hymenobacter sp. J193]|uniref:hypothetical protein n=1 Tax=Hymenobacter sp. J193 TaxID=2898429 RepID=UPI0021510775|nr:hypothetical protein [Hymenobacter sp. J193]MCR5888432.1 hypothetical protein [Hymenobacter sp. J193]